jgi:hypothetical protein
LQDALGLMHRNQRFANWNKAAGQAERNKRSGFAKAALSLLSGLGGGQASDTLRYPIDGAYNPDLYDPRGNQIRNTAGVNYDPRGDQIGATPGVNSPTNISGGFPLQGNTGNDAIPMFGNDARIPNDVLFNNQVTGTGYINGITQEATPARSIRRSQTYDESGYSNNMFPAYNIPADNNNWGRHSVKPQPAIPMFGNDANIPTDVLYDNQPTGTGYINGITESESSSNIPWTSVRDEFGYGTNAFPAYDIPEDKSSWGAPSSTPYMGLTPNYDAPRGRNIVTSYVEKPNPEYDKYRDWLDATSNQNAYEVASGIGQLPDWGKPIPERTIKVAQTRSVPAQRARAKPTRQPIRQTRRLPGGVPTRGVGAKLGQVVGNRLGFGPVGGLIGKVIGGLAENIVGNMSNVNSAGDMLTNGQFDPSKGRQLNNAYAVYGTAQARGGGGPVWALANGGDTRVSGNPVDGTTTVHNKYGAATKTLGGLRAGDQAAVGGNIFGGDSGAGGGK